MPEIRFLGCQVPDAPLHALEVDRTWRRVAARLDQLSSVDSLKYSARDLLEHDKIILIGSQGSGMTTSLLAMARIVNTAPDHKSQAMFVIDARKYREQTTLLDLSMYGAQQLLSAGLRTQMTVAELAACLTAWTQSGQLRWGIGDLTYNLGPEAAALVTEVKKIPKCIVHLAEASQAAIRRLQVDLDNLDYVYQLENLQPTEQLVYCEHYLELAEENYSSLQAQKNSEASRTWHQSQLEPLPPEVASELDRERLSLRHVDHQLETYPELATIPLGLAAICVAAENHYRLRDAAHLYYLERCCRAGLSAESLIGPGPRRSSTVTALLSLAKQYWEAFHTLDTATPMAETAIPILWPHNTTRILQSALATRLITPAYSPGGYVFSSPEVYHLLLAVALLDRETTHSGYTPTRQQLERSFDRSDMPKVLLSRIMWLAELDSPY